ncbi:isochorismate synthase [Leuconostoc palmae]|uniref:isochorismate synthase n=1 Tax=Leuconostoc palmae TaxID=501487 RepID=UPI001C7DF0BD|nr:isochorismate synthase [Leuconostoc palmae]
MKYTFSRELRDNDQQKLLLALDHYNSSAMFQAPNSDSIKFGFGAKKVANKASLINDTIVFGGRPFDDQFFEQSDIMNGYWFSPEIFVEIKNHMIYVFSGIDFDFDEWLNRFKQTTRKSLVINKIDKDSDWVHRVQQLIKILNADDNFKKVVFGRQKTIEFNEKVQIYRLMEVLKNQHNSYRVVLKKGDEIFFSATPERLVKLSKFNQVETAAIAGTITRGKTSFEDLLLEEKLLSSRKNLREHQYVVSQLSKQLKKIATTLTVPSKPVILKNQQVQHLYTPIKAQLNSISHVVDLVNLLHPTPALGGLPKILALDYIKKNEQYPRGLFASPVGYSIEKESGEFVVGIRSMLINQKRHIATVFAGAGIVKDSIALEEYNETELKFKAMIQALEDYNYDN